MIRLIRSEVERQCDDFLKSDFHSDLFDQLPDPIFVVNSARQVVYANKIFVDKFGQKGVDNLTGKRPGEYIKCINSEINIDGCGFSRYCPLCCLANVIKFGQAKTGVTSECNIIVKGGENLSYNITTWPFALNKESFMFCILQDITQKMTHQYLERTFLHDIQNSISVLYALHEVIDELTTEETRSTLKELSIKLNEEINAYRIISDAEKSTLKVFPESIDIAEMVKKITDEFLIFKVFRNRKINIKASQFFFVTDKTLLRRILTNLVKNALEAGSEKEPVEITITNKLKDKTCRIDVKSHPLIAESDQLNIFRKAFSTKGNGRGWGTYGIRLLAEHYLNGTVSFVSNPKVRTVFTVELPELKR